MTRLFQEQGSERAILLYRPRKSREEDERTIFSYVEESENLRDNNHLRSSAMGVPSLSRRFVISKLKLNSL